MIVARCISGKQPRISVWLDESEDKTLKKFHCVICGKIVFEYYNPIRIIIPGRHYKKTPKVIQCNGTVIIDKLSDEVVHIPPYELINNKHRYFQTRCHAKYWIS
jgi:uncharacterized protein with PIN domain